MTNSKKLLVILGPTASGKTKLAVRIAQHFSAEIISADSRQVYRNMDIGTGKDLSEYAINGNKIPYHLIDIVDAGQKYNLNDYINDFKLVYTDLFDKKKKAILCGGTGLYIEAVLRNFKYSAIPVNKILREGLSNYDLSELQNIFKNITETSYKDIADLSTIKRAIRAIEISTHIEKFGETLGENTSINHCIIGLNPMLELRRSLIEERLNFRLKNGLLEEVDALLKSGLTEEQLIYYGLEYKFVTLYLSQQMSIEELQQKLCIAIQQFAKRQMTYFRKMEKSGLKIHWIDWPTTLDEQFEQALSILNQQIIFK